MQTLLEMPELGVDEKAIVSSRWFDAPRALVWTAFADPQHVVEWWGPHGFTTTVLDMDLRAGGKWKLVMHGPDGTDYPNEMTFTEVVPGELVRPNLVGGRAGAEPITLKKTMTWTDENGGTRLTWRIDFPSRDERDTNVREYGSVQGLRDVYERLEVVLAKVAAEG